MSSDAGAPAAPSPSFHDLGVAEAVVRTLRSMRVTEPTPIQAAVLPDALAGRAVWLARNAAPATDHAPRGVMVSLDALSAGNSAQISTDALTPVQPVTAASPAPQTGATTQTPATDNIAPTPATAPSTPTPVVTGEQPAPAGGVETSSGGVDIPIAHAVTIQAADTLQALEQATPTQARAAPANDVHTGSGASGHSEDPTTTYISRVTSWLGSHKYYPKAARSSGAEGTVRLHIVIGRDGNVINVGIAHSSGDAALDQAAKDMVKRSEPLPAMSDNMMRTRLEIILPVTYALSLEPDAAVDVTR